MGRRITSSVVCILLATIGHAADPPIAPRDAPHVVYHALEIAREPSIVDVRSLAAHYRRIGEQQGDAIGRLTFETEAAFEAGRRTRRELLVNRTRSANGS